MLACQNTKQITIQFLIWMNLHKILTNPTRLCIYDTKYMDGIDMQMRTTKINKKPPTAVESSFPTIIMFRIQIYWDWIATALSEIKKYVIDIVQKKT